MQECLYLQANEWVLILPYLKKEPGSPAGQLTHLEFTGTPANKTILNKFAASTDVITLENEFIDYRILEYLESAGEKSISFIWHNLPDTG